MLSLHARFLGAFIIIARALYHILFRISISLYIKFDRFFPVFLIKLLNYLILSKLNRSENQSGLIIQLASVCVAVSVGSVLPGTVVPSVEASVTVFPFSSVTGSVEG